MTNNSDGLSPTLRPQLGVGWNRALPAAFGFDNAYKGDGVNDYFNVPIAANPFTSPNAWTIEFWLDNTTAAGSGGIFEMRDASNAEIINGDIVSNNIRCPLSVLSGSSISIPTTKIHYVATWNYTTKLYARYVNGVLSNQGTFSQTYSTVVTFQIGQRGGGGSFGQPLDEFRIYNKEISAYEVLLNYNSGAGNNPAATEFLEVWFKFQAFETLDFSLAQNNSDLRLGMRDYSGKNRHGQPFNMDTNPASSTYVLKPF